jgi:hypothetical protein
MRFLLHSSNIKIVFLSCSTFTNTISTLRNCVQGLARPFTVPGSQLLFCPKIYVTVIAHTPFLVSKGQQVNSNNLLTGKMFSPLKWFKKKFYRSLLLDGCYSKIMLMPLWIWFSSNLAQCKFIWGNCVGIKTDDPHFQFFQ